MKQLFSFIPCLLLLFLSSPELHAQYAAAKFTHSTENALLNMAYIDVYSPINAINDLTASLENKKINLEWSISGQSLPSSFVIERSYDGEHFEVIGSDATAFSDAHKRIFSFTDKPANKAMQHRDIFYRLGTVTENSKFQYTKPLLVRIKPKGIVEYITVFPHPREHDINMIVGLKENGYFVARVTNAQGQEIMKLQKKINSGQQQLSLAGSNQFSPGMYWLEVMVNSKEALKMKLIKE